MTGLTEIAGKRIVVLHSGGLDSTTLVQLARSEAAAVQTVSFFYGQRHMHELEASKRLATLWKLQHIEFDILSAFNPIRRASSSALLYHSDVPEGHYAQENMVQTIVPNRNMIMASLAIGYAQAIGYEYVGLAVHAGDHFIYPDCRPEFVSALGNASLAATDGAVKIYAPFLNVSKTDIVRLGSDLQVPFELTYSCYQGNDKHCGVCGTCTERIESFRNAGVEDPTQYENLEKGIKILEGWANA